MISFRRADGWEVSLRELPLARWLGASETVRAEEIVLSVREVYGVSTLLNATPLPPVPGASGQARRLD